MPQGRMIYHLMERFNAQVSVAYGFVPVLMALERILGVVDMDCLQAIQADYPVKCFQHLVRIALDVITGIKHMTRIQADAQPVLHMNTVDYGPEFLESPADFGPFSGHGFQQDPGGLLFGDGCIQGFCYQLYAFFHPLLHVTSRMQVIQVPRCELHPEKVIHEGVACEFPDTVFGSAQVQGIGGMCQDGTYVVLF